MDNKTDEDVEKVKEKIMKDMRSDGGSSAKGLDHPSGPVKLDDGSFQETIQKYPLVLVDFWAEWCGPCKMMEPVIEELAQSYQGDVVFGKLNVDNNSATAGQFGVSSIPTLILFKDGEAVEHIVGAQRGPALKKKLNRYLDK